MKCIACKHANFKAAPAYSKVGFVVCDKIPLSGSFQSLTFERQCGQFAAAAEATVSERTEWLGRYTAEMRPTA